MEQPALDARFDFAQTLAEEAGALALSYFLRLDTLTVKSKGLQDVVSEADLAVELLIRDRLKARFPDDGFLGEETGRGSFDGPAAIWVVDPIDGTQPFVSGMTSWCVSIGLVVDGAPAMGVVAAPARGETFAGRRGHPSTLNGTPIRVNTATAVTDGMLGVGYSARLRPHEFLPMFGRLIEAGAIPYRDGSGALMLCNVACGRLIGYVEVHINSWDCLAALAIIESAGGRINDFLGAGGLWNGNRVIAAPPDLYPSLEALVGDAAHAR